MTSTKSPPQLVLGYQIHVRLLGVYPIIWRRFLFRSENTFAYLYHAIQIAMNWRDEFLHRFKVQGKAIAIPRVFGVDGTHCART